MSGTTTAVKIRFVRCPKCKNILPEHPDIPVYECGCCYTRLRAKVRKSDTRDTLPDSGELDAAQVKKAEHFTNAKPAGKALHAGEYPVDQSGGTGRVKTDNCSDDQLSDAVKSPSGDQSDEGHDEPGKLDGDHLGGILLSVEKLNIGRDGIDLEDSREEHTGGVKLLKKDLVDNGDKSEIRNHSVEQPGISGEASPSSGFGEAKNENLFSPTREQDCITYSCQSAILDADSKSTMKIDESDVSEICKHDAELPGICNEAHPSNGCGEEKNGELILVRRKQDGISDADRHSSKKNDATEDILSDSPPSSWSEQPHEDAQYVMNLEKFGDTGEAVDFVNPSSELSGTLVDLSKSPATRSTQAYYDDGISSNDGTDDDPLLGRWINSFSSAHKPTANLAASNERLRREKFLVNSNCEMQHRHKNQPSTSSDNMHDAHKINQLKLNQGGVYNPGREGHPDQWRKLEDGNPSCVPFYHHGISTGYESSSPSYQLRNEYRWKSSFNPHDKMPNPMEEKARLLRMAYELQEELNTRCCPNESTRIPYQDHVTNIQQEVDCPCCFCLKETAPPPVRTCLHDRVHCGIHSGVRCYDAYGSCSSSPERRVDFLPPMCIRGTESADQVDGDYGLSKHKKRKQTLVKRYLWPIAGAAPFIICPFCMKQLHLPADFLLLGKQCHRLKCGACGEVLKFSLRDQSHLVPYTLVLQAPPPSEIDECTDAVSRKYVASSSDARDHPPVDPASCSDDSLHSADKGHSVDDTAGKVSHSSQGNYERQKNPDPSISRNKYKYLDQRHQRSTALSMSKRVLLENVDQAERGRHPLHHLLGYSSPGRVIFGRSRSGASSYYQGEHSAEEA